MCILTSLLFVWCPVIENNLSGARGWVLLCLKTETEPASEMLRVFKKVADWSGFGEHPVTTFKVE